MTKRVLSIALATLVVGLASTVAVEAGVRRVPGDPLVRLTFDLEDRALDAARRVNQGSRWLTLRERLAVQRLDALRREAHRFRDDVRRHGARSRQARLEFQQLQRAYRDADRSLTALRGPRLGRRTLAPVTRVMQDLSYAYDVRLARNRNDHRPGHLVYDGPGPLPHGRRIHVDLFWDDEHADDEHGDWVYAGRP